MASIATARRHRRAISSRPPRVAEVTLFPLRPAQEALYLARQRFNVWVCHRRFGKSYLALRCLLEGALTCPLPYARFAYVAPLRNQAKTIMWDILKRITGPLDALQANEAELRLDFPNGHRLTLFGADNPDAMRGIYLDGVVFDEYAQMRPRTWHEVVRPALADRQGWAIFIGTPLGRNHFHDLYQAAQTLPEWHAALYRASETGIVPDAELALMRQSMAPEQYAQELEASFESALIGAYYAEVLQTARDEQRITAVPHDPTQPVYTAWDLGLSDATAIWFIQHIGQRFHVIDYLEASDHGMEFYVKALHHKPYTYAKHFLPFDIEHRDWSANGHTRLDMIQQLGLTPVQVVPRGNVSDGIQATRNMFPRFLFDQEKCHAGIEALANYRREWSEEHQAWSGKPLHNWASHGSDSLRYFCMGWHEEPPRTPRQPQAPMLAGVPPDQQWMG